MSVQIVLDSTGDHLIAISVVVFVLAILVICAIEALKKD